MPRPIFTTDEQYLINAVQSSSVRSQSNSYMWGYVSGGFLLAGFAAYYESIAMLLSAFAIVCGFRIYEDRLQSRWTPIWRSIVDKYEESIHNAEKAISADQPVSPKSPT